jgi:hypothetical protein
LRTILFDLEVVDSPPLEIPRRPEPYLTVIGTIPASSDPIRRRSDREKREIADRLHIHAVPNWR